MCLSCGCHEPYESHGNAANITMDDVMEAASVAGISPDEVVANMQADLERRTDLGETTASMDVSRGFDLPTLRESGDVIPDRSK